MELLLHIRYNPQDKTQIIQCASRIHLSNLHKITEELTSSMMPKWSRFPSIYFVFAFFHFVWKRFNLLSFNFKCKTKNLLVHVTSQRHVEELTLGFSYRYITKGNSQIVHPGHFWPSQRSVWQRDDSLHQIGQKHSHFSIENALNPDCVATKSIGICLSLTWHSSSLAQMLHSEKGINSQM